MTQNIELQDLLCFNGISDITSLELNKLLNENNEFDYKIIASTKK